MITRMHYALVEEYKNQQYKDLLMTQHVASDKIHINKVSFPGGIVNDEYDFWGYILEKDGTKYLLSCMNDVGEEIKIKDLLPIFPEDLEDVAYRGQAYKIINTPVPARIPPKQSLTFKELVLALAETGHSNKDHQVLSTIIGLIQRYYRCYVRVCSPPGFGKDSLISVMGSLVGGCGSVTNPTVAKLEYMTYLNHLVINEVSSIGKGEWALIQQFLLDVGDFKPSTFKRSRGDREIIDLTNLSISLFFNDIDQYANPDKFFDNKTDGNVKDRFVPFRFFGGYTESFEKITELDPVRFVKQEFSYYRSIVSSYYYYKENIDKLQREFVVPDLTLYPKRWRNNLMYILKGINLFSEDEEEYLRLWGVLKNGIKDYQDMLSFPEHFTTLMGKMRVPISVYGSGCRLEPVVSFLTAKLDEGNDRSKTLWSARLNYIKRIVNEPLFANRNVMCSCYDEKTLISSAHKDLEVYK
jgi:hypothetical protein